MAGFPNKIIINAILTAGSNKFVKAALRALGFIGQEIEELDMLKDTVDLEERLSTACLKHREAELEYERELNDIIIESRKRINAKKGLTTGPGPTRVP